MLPGSLHEEGPCRNLAGPCRASTLFSALNNPRAPLVLFMDTRFPGLTLCVLASRCLWKGLKSPLGSSAGPSGAIGWGLGTAFLRPPQLSPSGRGA